MSMLELVLSVGGTTTRFSRFFKIVEKLVNFFRDVVGSSVVVLLFHLV